MQRRCPNLFIIGAMKSGSTTLHEYLAMHPRIRMSAEKEPGFFVPELWQQRPAREYYDLFTGSEDCDYAGESSTHYSKLPLFKGVAERIHKYNPQSRILYVVRDPYRRTISHYYHALRSLSTHAETRPILKALKADETYWTFSDYATQAEPYINLFGREAVYILPFDDLVNEPLKALEDLCGWLGLEREGLGADPIRANAAPQTYTRARGIGLLNRIRYSRAWSALSPLMPRRLKKLGNSLAEARTDARLSEDDEKRAIAMLKPEFERYITRVEELLGRDLSHWRK